MLGMTDKEWQKINEFVGKVVDIIEIVYMLIVLPALFVYAIYLISQLP